MRWYKGQQQLPSRFVEIPKRMYVWQNPIIPEMRRGMLRITKIVPAVPFTSRTPRTTRTIPMHIRKHRSIIPTFCLNGIFMVYHLPPDLIDEGQTEKDTPLINRHSGIPQRHSSSRMPIHFVHPDKKCNESQVLFLVLSWHDAI